MWWVIVVAMVFAHIVVLSWSWSSPQSLGGGLHVLCKQRNGVPLDCKHCNNWWVCEGKGWWQERAVARTRKEITACSFNEVAL
jgi:hypothetical protein